MKAVHYTTRLMAERDALQVLGLSAVCGGSVRSVDDARSWCHTIGSWGIVVEVEDDLVGYCLLDSDKSGLLIRDLRAIGADDVCDVRHATVALFAHVIDCLGKRDSIQAFVADDDPIFSVLLRHGGMRAIQYRREAGLWLFGVRIGGAS